MNRKDKKFRERIKVNIGDNPFDADEMLLQQEFRGKTIANENNINRQIGRLGDNPFDAEDMLLCRELKKMDEER